MNPSRISDRTTIGTFFRQVDRLGDRLMLRHHDGSGWRDVTWRECGDRVQRIAVQLVAAGVQPQDRVALMSENRVEWVYCDLAIQTAGAVTVPVYPSTTRPVTQAIVGNCEAVLGIAAGEKAAERLAPLRTVRMDREIQDWLSGESPPEPEALAEVEERAQGVQPDDVATIIYTSGTTGEPKGVILAQRSIADIVDSCLRAFDVGPQDIALSFLPFSHVLERVNGLYLAIASGLTAWLARGMNQLVEDIGECRPTVMVSVPRVYEKMHQAILARVRDEPFHRRVLFGWAVDAGRRKVRGQPSPLHPLADRLVLSGLRTRLTGGRIRFFITGGAALTRDVEEFFWALGIRILQGWGMTETSSAATANTEAHHRFDTAGQPLPGVEIKIAEDGEILVRSPGNMLGYYRNTEATAQAMDDGWVLTGDIGELDGDGFLHITDRKKDLIKTSGGKFVAPQPLETELQQDALIERAVVIGDLRPYVSALVVPDWGTVRHELEIDGDPVQLVWDERVRGAIQARIDSVNSRLGSWETIKRFTLLPRDFREEEGELTPSLKVKRRVIQERYAGLIDEMYEAPRQAAGS